MKVTRRSGIVPLTGEPPTLRFTTGKVVRPSDCPAGISAHCHWLFVDGAAPDMNGPVNTVCECTARA